MYFKVALLFIIGIVFSGCANNTPKPKATNLEDNVTVVTEISEDNSIVIPIQRSKVIKKKQNKYNLKPEPFSIESNEDDPELLGPQSTLDSGLNQVDTQELNNNSKSLENTKKSNNTIMEV